MTDKPVPGSEQVQTTPAPFVVADIPHSPFIYFENAPALGQVNGLIRITLSAQAAVLSATGLATQEVVVAYLRTNIEGAKALRKSLDDALLLAMPTPDGSEQQSN